MTTPNFLFIAISLALIFNLATQQSLDLAFGQEEISIKPLATSLNNVKSFIVADNEVFFVENNPSLTSEISFQPDMELKKIKDNLISKLATNLTGARELSLWNDHIYLTTLADSCLGSNVCNTVNIVRIPRNGGEVEVILQDLLMKVGLAFDANYIYFTEGSMEIWRMKFDGTEKTLIVVDKGIPSDMQVMGDYIYYMLEGENASIKRIPKDGRSAVEVLADGLLFPHSLKIYNDFVYWVEDAEGGTHEVVRRVSINGNNLIENVWKVLALTIFSDGTVVQGNIEIGKDFIYNVDVSKMPRTIQMMSIKDGEVQDLLPVYFLVGDMIFEDNSLFILGYDGSYGIWKVDLSTVVPEFPVVIIIMSVAIMTVILVNKIARNKIIIDCD